jgi:hypothetical protein
MLVAEPNIFDIHFAIVALLECSCMVVASVHGAMCGKSRVGKDFLWGKYRMLRIKLCILSLDYPTWEYITLCSFDILAFKNGGISPSLKTSSHRANMGKCM